jgi:hypothetical protein
MKICSQRLRNLTQWNIFHQTLPLYQNTSPGIYLGFVEVKLQEFYNLGLTIWQIYLYEKSCWYPVDRRLDGLHLDVVVKRKSNFLL